MTDSTVFFTNDNNTATDSDSDETIVIGSEYGLKAEPLGELSDLDVNPVVKILIQIKRKRLIIIM